MTQPTPVMAAIRDFVITDAAHQQAKQQRDAARKTLLALFPHEIGEFPLTEGDYTVTVKYPEKDVWDTEQLKAYYGSDKPHYVKESLSIDRRVLKTLPEEERDALLKCVSQKPGSPEIDIVKGTP